MATSGVIMAGPSSADTFRIEEYRSLRKEIELYLTEARSQERYIVIACGVIWGWLIVNRIQAPLPWFIPLIVVVATAIRMIAINAHFKSMAAYIVSLENSFGVKGWEQHPRTSQKIAITGANYLLCIGLILLGILGFRERYLLTQAIAATPPTQVVVPVSCTQPTTQVALQQGKDQQKSPGK